MATKGQGPKIQSTWGVLTRWGNTSMLFDNAKTSSNDTAWQDVWKDWWFDAAAATEVLPPRPTIASFAVTRASTY